MKSVFFVAGFFIFSSTQAWKATRFDGRRYGHGDGSIDRAW